MNQNSNFDPVTGQPLNNSVAQPSMPNQVNYQQPVPTFNNGQTIMQNNKQKKSPKDRLFITLVISVIGLIMIVAILLYIMMQEKRRSSGCQCPAVEENSYKCEDDTTGTVDPNTKTTYDADGAFLMPIEDVFSITGTGTVVTGRVMRGKVKKGDTIQIIGLDQKIKTVTVSKIEMFRKEQDLAAAGDDAGVALTGVTRDEIKRGQVLAQPNSIMSVKKFEAEVDILATKDGGRHTPFFTGFRPQFYFWTTDVYGTITLPSNIEMVNPGDKAKITVALESAVAMEVGTEFSMREGGSTIGKGKVTKLN